MSNREIDRRNYPDTVSACREAIEVSLETGGEQVTLSGADATAASILAGEAADHTPKEYWGAVHGAPWRVRVVACDDTSTPRRAD